MCEWQQNDDEHRRWIEEYEQEKRMKFAAKSGGDFEIVPAGNHPAICNAIVDLGVQPGRGQYPDPKHEVYIRFELPTKQIEYEKDGVKHTGPMSIGRRFTASMSAKANLRKFIEAWFGKSFPSDEAASDFDHSKLLGRMCLLNVTHTEKGDRTYANMQGASPIPDGMKTDYEQHNKSIMFDLTAPDPDDYDALPEWLRKVIDDRICDNMDQRAKKAKEERTPAPAGDMDDDIPFAIGWLVPSAGLLAGLLAGPVPL